MNLTTQISPNPEIAVAPLNTAAVRQQVEADGVVKLSSNGMTAHGFVDFLSTLGPLMFTEGEIPLKALPDLNIVTNVGRTKPPRSVFHSDTTYVRRPPSFSGLIAADVPEQGGATLFTDQYAAFEALPDALQTLLMGATMLHSVTEVDLSDGAERDCRHPVLRRHPGTGRTALYLTTTARCSELRLADGSDRSDLIQTLYDHSLNLQPPRAHRWRAGDVVIWDNRCTLHAADHSAVVGNRTLYRGMVRGEIPESA
ncbi:TauD/TfdA family dioxygenase [Actibacterium sp. 188UL27-1]|uniref:TauD/TfdA dioxygenase family protein n=1 Tax=Actibacterium sp. 188UL27-1 TaxID=2786961 RepID=UPI001957CAED|nr:TauD/TfdA family dioxygenase [Actibacterium sp. 188UL27-1]MBM7066752.1 TauD/TfdA family dioxygenase [Actibacterium sp. 188UL27-1]